MSLVSSTILSLIKIPPDHVLLSYYIINCSKVNTEIRIFAFFGTGIAFLIYLCYYVIGDAIMLENFVITKINRIILVDKDEYLEKTTHFLHPLSCNELIFHFSGTSTVQFNGKTLFCDTDTVRFLPKGENREYIVEREDYGEYIDIFFDTDVPVSDEAFCLKAENSVVTASLFKKIFSVWTSKTEGYYFECISLLYKIFAELQKKAYLSGRQYNYIKPAVDYIEGHFLKECISVELLSELCGISTSYLKKLFIKRFGVPPVKYIIQMKLNYAADLLRSGLYPLSQIAAMCGYPSYYYFSRQFKSYFGASPKSFAAKYKSSK